MSQTTITLLFLVFTIISFILEKIPLGLTASICAIGLTLTGVVDATTTFSQYVNSNVILCVGMFVVGQALFETGMANKIGGLVTKFARTEKTLIIAIMVIVGVMSGFLSNTGTAAVLIPVVCGIADESGYSRSRLLMPLVFAAALGGNLSIIGAPGNLMGVNALQEMGLSTSFFMYAPVGVPMLLIGILYFILFILTIPAMNWVVMNVGTVCTADGPCLIPVWPGIMAPSGVLMAGVALVLRDGLQAKLGVRWSLYAIIIGAALSALFSEPSLVLASVMAFFFSELADLVVYTPMRKKWPAWAIMASGLVGSMVDSAIFLSLAFGSIEFIFGQVLGKFWMSLAVALLIGYLHSRRAKAVQDEILSR